MAGYKGMNAAPSIRGTCAICKQLNITNYHYRKAHGLVPKDIFSSDDKMWRCRKHLLKSPDPHTMMGHYWRAHMYSHSSKLPYKTREPLNGRGRYYGYEEMNKLSIISSAAIPNQTATSEVVASTSDYPPITAEAIVNAFEARIKAIDEQLEAKDKIISEQKKTIDETTKALNEGERELLNRKPLEEPTPERTDGLVSRLFKR